MPGRIPNTGPYIVSYALPSLDENGKSNGKRVEVERQTWKHACDTMRQWLIENRSEVQVSFT